MKKLKFLIPMLSKKTFELYVFDLALKRNSLEQLVLKYSYILGYLLVFLTLFLFPLANFIYPNLSKDTSVINLLFILMPLNIGFYLVTVVLNGKRKFIDPTFFLAILIFALGTTMSSVLNNTPNLANTFGNSTLRSLGGISVMVYIATYYLNHIYLHNRQLLRRALKVLIAGIYFYIILSVLSQYALQSPQDLTLIILDLGGIFVLTKSSITFRKLKSLLALSLMIILGLIVVKTDFSQANLVLVTIPLALSLALFVLLIISSKRQLFKILLNDTKKDLNNIFIKRNIEVWEIARIVSVWAIIFSPIILIIYSFLALQQNPAIYNLVINLFNSNLKAFNLIADFSKNIDLSSLSTFLFGVGMKSTVASGTYISNIIVAQGFLGLASYLFIGVYGIIVASRFVYSNFKKGGNYMLPSLLLFIIVLIPIESFLFYPGLHLIYLWWIAFSFTSLKYYFKGKKALVKLTEEDFKIRFNKSSKARMLNFTVVMGIIIVFCYISYSFVKLIQ